MTPESDIIPPFIRTRIYMYTVKPGGKEEEDDEDSVEDEECGRFGEMFMLNPDLPCEERLGPQAVLERRLGSLTAKANQEMTLE
ncbi:uncharacterized protein isoform X2 [Salmo salar]|uniref:Uncharacterized protein isoform X2 n=1 Tax=Salmo salar TaxID=8030 RepID=A0ABM3CR57_SALSA|nr:uncharacterized protein LOC106566788 isoform X2 [Salmo salar]